MSDYKINPENLISNASFNRWVNGEASQKERYYWDGWIMKHPHNRALAMQAQERIGGFTIQPKENIPESGVAWGKLQKKIDQEKINNVSRFRHTNQTKSKGLTWLLRVAAMFLLAGITGVLVTQFGSEQTGELSEIRVNEVSTEIGEQKTVTFHDGSKVILNGNSTMQYAIDRNDLSNIKVELTGEAYFSVENRKTGQSSLQITTEQGIVSVLGTRFVVSTRANKTRVVLEKGAVALKPVHYDTEVILEPGELGEFAIGDGDIHTRRVNTDVYSSWVYGRLIFEQASLKEVMERLENTFGVRVVVYEPELLETKISGSIENSDLEVITSALSKMLNIHIYESDKENVIYVGERSRS